MANAESLCVHAALSKDISVGSGGVLTAKASSQTLRTGNIMNVVDLSNAYKMNPGQLQSFKQLVLAGDDGSTNIYEVRLHKDAYISCPAGKSCMYPAIWS